MKANGGLKTSILSKLSLMTTMEIKHPVHILLTTNKKSKQAKKPHVHCSNAAAAERIQ